MEFISLLFVLVRYSHSFVVICHKILNRILVAPVHLGFIMDPFREHITTKLCFRYRIYFIIIFLVNYSYIFVVICQNFKYF